MRIRSLAEYSHLIAIPPVLRADDGRIFRVRSWKPVAAVGEAPTVSIEAYIVDAKNGGHSVEMPRPAQKTDSP